MTEEEKQKKEIQVSISRLRYVYNDLQAVNDFMDKAFSQQVCLKHPYEVLKLTFDGCKNILKEKIEELLKKEKEIF